MANEIDNEVAELEQAQAALLAEYPDFPLPEPIETLDLIMKREYAIEILTGRKKIEFRDVSEHYCKRLLDKRVFEYVDKHMDDERFVELAAPVIDYVRPVYNIHFHDYNNKWFLDVSVDFNMMLAMTMENALYFKEEFNIDELMEDAEYAEAHPDKEPLEYFIFKIDEVLDTNLE